MQEEKLVKKLNGPGTVLSATDSEFKAPAPKKGLPLSGNESDRDNTLTDEDQMTQTFECTMGGTVSMSKKKKQYLEQDIVDRSGAYNYAEDPNTYKKARKRLQNRESAVRSRMKKR